MSAKKRRQRVGRIYPERFVAMTQDKSTEQIGLGILNYAAQLSNGYPRPDLAECLHLARQQIRVLHPDDRKGGRK